VFGKYRSRLAQLAKDHVLLYTHFCPAGPGDYWTLYAATKGSDGCDGVQPPVTWRQALHREADDLLRSQLNAQGEQEACETRSASSGVRETSDPELFDERCTLWWCLSPRTTCVQRAAPCIATLAGARRRGK
jgi:hypothetical protein